MTVKNIVSINEAAAIFGLSWKTIARMIDQHGAPVVSRGRKGKEARVDTAALLSWMLELETATEGSEYRRARLGKIEQERIALNLDNTQHLAKLVPTDDVLALYQATIDILESSMATALNDIAGRDHALRNRIKSEMDRLMSTVRKRFNLEGG